MQYTKKIIGQIKQIIVTYTDLLSNASKFYEKYVQVLTTFMISLHISMPFCNGRVNKGIFSQLSLQIH